MFRDTGKTHPQLALMVAGMALALLLGSMTCDQWSRRHAEQQARDEAFTTCMGQLAAARACGIRVDQNHQACFRQAFSPGLVPGSGLDRARYQACIMGSEPAGATPR